MEWGVIFDWDGVVVDSSEAHKMSWERLAAEINQPIPANHMELGFGKKNTTIIPDILGWTREPEHVTQLSNRKEALYRELLATGHGEVLPGARELLEELASEGIACAVGSSTDRANIEQAIRQFALNGYFAGIAAAEDCVDGKPAPDVFLAAAAKIGIPPQQCIVIEDAPYGIEAARRAGMKSVGLLTSHKPSTMSDADLVIPDLSHIGAAQLKSLLDS
ncbi:MAG TPA: HAD family phosphatase [Oceanipulchritudo sp.]|nr:HAD family phosphatase [Oceanipulchritudo sp.]